jgi:thioredoxin-related protein
MMAEAHHCPPSSAPAQVATSWLGASSWAGGLRAVAVALALAAPLISHASANLPSQNLPWISAASNAEVDEAFAQARREAKPVLLYWGASWCPPCNQLKATLFKRQDFASLARSFVAVHVDGDRPGAQALGTRFKVRGYPSVVLMTAAGAEITRLPGDADAESVMSLLQTGLAGGRPVAALLADARSGKPLNASEWRMLAFHGWEGDFSGLLSEGELPSVLAELASKSPAGDGDTTTRLWLKALAASDDGKGLKPDDALRERVQRVLADEGLTRRQMDVLAGGADDIVKALAAGNEAQQRAWVARFDAAFARMLAPRSAPLAAQAELSQSDRAGLLYARTELARLGQGKDVLQPQMPPALLAELQRSAAEADARIADAYERQAVLPTYAFVLRQAGLWAQSDALLKSNLSKSHSPYYFMSMLGSNARRQGRIEEALRWYEQAFSTSVGPATRLEWGAGYLAALIDLAPQDARRIEQLATQLLREASAAPSALQQRSARSLLRISNRLLAWNESGAHNASLQRLRQQWQPHCAKVDAADGQRSACEALLVPRAPKAS